MTPRRSPGLPWPVILTVCLGTFMGALDASVVIVAYPTFTAAFHVPVSLVQWVGVAYLLTSSTLVAIFGRVSDMVGHKRIYVAGFTVFLAGSILCGVATGIGALLAFRVLQAVGSAMLVANSVAILSHTVGAARMGTALGVLETAVSVALVVGPVVGGLLIQAFSWRMIFFINVPVAIGAMLLARRVLPALEGRGRRERFDVAGAVTFGAGLGTLLLGASLGPIAGWAAPAVDVLLGAGVVLLAAFFVIERRVHPPMLDLSLFRSRQFAGANAAKLCAYAASFTVSFVVPFYLQRVLHYSPGTVGIAMTPMPAALAAGSLLGGPLSDRIGSHVLAPLGMVIATLGAYLFTQVSPAHGYVGLAVAMVVMDFGMGLFIAPNDAVIMNSAPRDKQGVAGGVLALMRSAGMIIGLTLAATILQSHLGPMAAGGGAPGGGTGISPQALLQGVQNVYAATIIICLLATALSLLRGRPPKVAIDEDAWRARAR
ncbi:MAG TPA: MFS transporter [bacterium]|nr:MFS transporter [bacterium]